jgi:Uma2 family endonuclease
MSTYTITPTEYLAQERLAEEKHEYYKGKVTDLAGASLKHNQILANLMREVGIILKGKACRILPSDMRVTVPSGEAFMYPDAVIVCKKPELMDDRFDTLLNPVVIFEICSPSTKDHDRGKKFHFYRQIPSFKEYVLIDSLQVFVEISHRQADDSWKFEASSDPDGRLRINSIQSSISLEEIYRNVY